MRLEEWLACAVASGGMVKSVAEGARPACDAAELYEDSTLG